MKLSHGLHLAYCTNIHRGESWSRTLEALQRYTLAVRDRICPEQPYAIGLRLSDQAARELSEPSTLRHFQRWLAAERCYVFTINGFPFGRFHGTRVKEQVYLPDWTTLERLEYTNRLFDLLAELVPEGIEGSVSTVPGSFKEFITTKSAVAAMRNNLWQCVEHIAALTERTGKLLHLGLEPEPLCYLETSQETIDFIEVMRAEHPGDPRLRRHLGVNYDACHLAIQFEEPTEAIRRFRAHDIRISKFHLSSALRVIPTAEQRRTLARFVEDIYFHQVIERRVDGSIRRYRDLDVALAEALDDRPEAVEWRIHFHVPLHQAPDGALGTTADHLLGVLEGLARDPALCSHLEMETYTWEVLPPEMKQRDVVDQLVDEYRWTLRELSRRGITPDPGTDSVGTRIQLNGQPGE